MMEPKQFNTTFQIAMHARKEKKKSEIIIQRPWKWILMMDI